MVQAARVVRCGLANNPFHPSLSVMLVKLARRVRGADPVSSGVGCKDPVLGALKAEVNVMMGGTDVAGFVSQCADYAKKVVLFLTAWAQPNVE